MVFSVDRWKRWTQEVLVEEGGKNDVRSKAHKTQLPRKGGSIFTL